MADNLLGPSYIDQKARSVPIRESAGNARSAARFAQRGMVKIASMWWFSL
jgi:hypothetical protein